MGNGEGCEDEGKDAGVRVTLWTYCSSSPTWRLESCCITESNCTWRVKIPPLLHAGWISTDLQAGSLGGQWWFWGEFPSFLWNWGFTSFMGKFHPLNQGITDPWKGVGAEQETLELSHFRHRLLQSIPCIILNLGLFLYARNWLARLL